MTNKGAGNGVFVDWLTATEYHPQGGLPLLLDGVQATFDAAGNCRFERAIAARVAGSYDTAVRIRCDGVGAHPILPSCARRTTTQVDSCLT